MLNIYHTHEYSHVLEARYATNATHHQVGTQTDCGLFLRVSCGFLNFGLRKSHSCALKKPCVRTHQPTIIPILAAEIPLLLVPIHAYPHFSSEVTRLHFSTSPAAIRPLFSKLQSIEPLKS